MKVVFLLLFAGHLVGAEEYAVESRSQVNANGITVDALCQVGDELVRGDCFGFESGDFPMMPVQASLTSAPSARPGWSCSTEKLKVQDTAIVTARAVCRKK